VLPYLLGGVVAVIEPRFTAVCVYIETINNDDEITLTVPRRSSDIPEL
jgi:hypothetical protein